MSGYDDLIADLRADLTERRRPTPKHDPPYKEGEHRWVTVNGHRVMIDTKGKNKGPVNAPGWMKGASKKGLKQSDLTDAEKETVKEGQKRIDNIAGKKSGVEVAINDKGKPVLRNPKVEDALEEAGEDPTKSRVGLADDDVGGDWDGDTARKGKGSSAEASMLNTFASLVGLVDVFAGLAISMAGASAKVVEGSAKKLMNALETWQSSGYGG